MKIFYKIASQASLDMIARLSFLEGVAGKTPGTWLKTRPAKGLAEARGQLPQMDPIWFSKKDTGLFNAAVRGAGSVKNIRGEDAEQIALDLISESHLPGGRASKSIFYGAGKKNQNSKKLKEGGLAPTFYFGVISKWAQRAAQALARRHEEKLRKDPTRDESGVYTDPVSQQPTKVDDEVRKSFMFKALLNPDLPYSKEIRRAVIKGIDGAIRNKTKKQIYAAAFRNLLDGNFAGLKLDQAIRKINRKVREELKASPATMSNYMGKGGSKFIDFLSKLSKLPSLKKVLREIEESAVLHQMGYGESRGFTAKKDRPAEKDKIKNYDELREQDIHKTAHKIAQAWLQKKR